MGMKEEPVFGDDKIIMENENKPEDAKRTPMQDDGCAVNEENLKCDCNGIAIYYIN